MDLAKPMIVASGKAAAVAITAGGGLTALLAAGSNSEWVEFVKTYGVPMAMVIFFVGAGYSLFLRLTESHNDLQKEFRDALRSQVAESNLLHSDTNRLLEEQARQLERQSSYLQELCESTRPSHAKEPPKDFLK